MREEQEKYHHSLKALAIRERKIYIVGSPKLNIKGTPVFLDVESARELFQRTATAKAISEYLVLLSVCETCRNKRIDFLDFLRSGEKDIEVFAAFKGRKQQNKIGG